MNSDKLFGVLFLLSLLICSLLWPVLGMWTVPLFIGFIVSSFAVTDDW